MLQPILRNDDMNETTSEPPVTIKKYANRRLYNTATSSYVTLEDLSQMVKDGTDFAVFDARTGEEITRTVLTQIIVEEESKSGQQNLLPISFLRQLIGFYGDSMQWMVPEYLKRSMDEFSKNQEQIRTYFQSTFGGMFPFGSAFEEMGKQNMAMFEQAMNVFSSYAAQGGIAPTSTTSSTATSSPSTSSSSSTAEAADEVCATSSDSSDKTSWTSSSSSLPSSSSASTSATPSVSETPIATVSTFRSREGSSTPSVAPSVTPVAPVTPVTPVVASSPAPTSTPVAATPSVAPASAPSATPMPHVQSATAASSPTADDMQQKIANLQRQLADLAKNRG